MPKKSKDAAQRQQSEADGQVKHAENFDLYAPCTRAVFHLHRPDPDHWLPYGASWRVGTMPNFLAPLLKRALALNHDLVVGNINNRSDP